MMTEDSASQAPEEFWDEFYGKSERVWSGRPNPTLVSQASGLRPGTALDVGCGEGGDAIWLAGRGWIVTGADISEVALERAAGHARDAGVGERIEWQRHDLSTSFPDGSFDLVNVHFLHSPTELAADRVLRSAADAVGPGGTLLIAGHASFALWEGDEDEQHGHHDHDVHFPTPDEMLAALELKEGQWRIEVNESVGRVMTDREGRRGTRTDYVLRLRRVHT